MRPAIALVTVAALVLSGCVDTGGLPQLEGTVDQRTAEWGQAVQFTITNVGESRYPAPVTVDVVARNGTVVFTYEDVTAGRGIPANGQVSVSWNGLNHAGRPVLWGNYTMRVEGGEASGVVEFLRPPNYALEVDPVPREAPAGEPITFQVENNGTVWLNGSLTVAAGRQGNIFYNNTVPVELAPGDHYNLTWNGHKPNGDPPEAKRYLVAARMELGEGPTPFAQDFFTVTEG